MDAASEGGKYGEGEDQRSGFTEDQKLPITISKAVSFEGSSVKISL